MGLWVRLRGWLVEQRDLHHRGLALVFCAVALTAITPMFLYFVSSLGWRIPQDHMAADYMTGVFTAVILTLFLLPLPIERAEKKALLTVWGAKCMVTLGLMLFYEWNYGLDAYGYFELSQTQLPDLAPIHIGDGTNNLGAVLWFFEHEIIHTASYHAQKVIVSFVGLWGIYLLYRGLLCYSERVTPRLLLLIGLFPSVLFWSSILGKDPINLFGNCLFFYGFLCLYRRHKPVYLIPMLAGLGVVGLFRNWLVPVLLVPLVVLQVAKIKHFATKMAVVAVLCTLGFNWLLEQGESLSIATTMDLAREMNAVSKSWNIGGSATAVPEFHTVGSMVRFLPSGMFTALFRPLPGEVLNIFGLFAGVENLVLIYLLYRSLRNFWWYTGDRDLSTIGITYVLSWGVLYAFISPQNLGSAVRFKLQVLPMMLALLLHLAYPEKAESQALAEGPLEVPAEGAGPAAAPTT